MKIKTVLGVAALVASMFLVSGCTVTARTNGNPAIVYYGGYYGYYNSTVFCDWSNNYCGTGVTYGIYDGGLGYGGYYGGSDGGYYGSSGGSDGSTGTVGSSGSVNYGYSAPGTTRDTDLQQADLQQADVATRAQSVSQQFQMNYSAAVQLTQLADKVQAMTQAGSMTAEDRQAITESALSVAGISSDDMNSAIASMIQNGNSDAVNALMDKAATNLGMPSSVALRNQILPALGINVGTSN